jgi:CRP/FNR family transcriptional regulator, cyclic AMP receptor protein
MNRAGGSDVSKPTPPDMERERHALFPWFPAHRVRRSERELRVESLLTRIPLFNAVPPHRLRIIAEIARPRVFAAGQVLFREGDRGSTLHVIRSGRLDVVREGGDGESLTLASLGPGAFVGELALFDHGPRSATVVAAEDSETLSIGRPEILDVMNRYPEVALAFLTSVGERLRSTDDLLGNVRRNRSGETS